MAARLNQPGRLAVSGGASAAVRRDARHARPGSSTCMRAGRESAKVSEGSIAC
jgi:hypothetical protein